MADTTIATGQQDEERPSFRDAMRIPQVRILATSRAASKLALAMVSYGAMVWLATQGASQLQISLVASSTYLAALLFGFQGGALADLLSKRSAVLLGYLGQAAVCIIVPILFGTDVLDLIFIMFVSSALMQLISPSLKSAVALVSTPGQLATTSAMVSVVGSIASAVGSCFLAPLLIKRWDIDLLLFIAGGIYLLGAVRTLAMPRETNVQSIRQATGGIDWRPTALSMRTTANWVVSQRDVAAMILMGAIVVSLFEAFNTMIPVYIRDVLHANPANAIYIFAPAGIGFLIGMFLTPKLMHSYGERLIAVVATGCMAISMILFGAINAVAPIFAPFSPLRLIGWLTDTQISDAVLAASLLAIPANFGSTAAGAAVQTFINRRVPLVRQGATFGLQEVQENAFTLVTILALGVISGIVGPQVVFIFAPIVILGAVLWLIRYSFRTEGDHALARGEALHILISEAPERGDQTSEPVAPPVIDETAAPVRDS